MIVGMSILIVQAQSTAQIISIALRCGSGSSQVQWGGRGVVTMDPEEVIFIFIFILILNIFYYYSDVPGWRAQIL